jgi:hypothetical protein
MAAGSLNLNQVVLAQQGSILHWFWLPLLPLFLVYFISGVAETNRAPFDVAEGESEIVAGFHVDYSGMAFAVFFLAEYANMILVSALASTMFLGGWLSPFEGIPVLGQLFSFVPGRDLAGDEDFIPAVVFLVVPRHIPAVSLRSDHAVGLESLYPGHAGMVAGHWLGCAGPCRPVV